MEKKIKLSLAKKSTIVFIMLLIIQIATLVIMLVFYVDDFETIRFWHGVVFSVLFFSLIIIGIYFYREIVLPYRQTKKILLQFNEGITIDELFKIKNFLYTEMDVTLKKIEELLNRTEAIKISKKQAEYLALQNQINPHFLYNTLEAIRGDALSMNMINIAQTTEALATFFRYTISKLDHLVTLNDELDNIENYFLIQRYRFGEKVNLEIEFNENEGKILDYMVPKLTLQPIIENAVIHGLECKTTPGKVKVHIQTTQSRLLINIVDDGIGMDEETLEKVNKRLAISLYSIADDKESEKGGIALVNVNERIHLLFGEEYGLRLSSHVDLGTDVEITFPLITEGSEKNR